ncbi:MAG TPA: class I SAM-dependent methyltransferase, partial [Gammaproteobacteria bacterium]
FTTADSADEKLISKLLIYACYVPLWQSGFATRLNDVSADAWPSALRSLIRVCVHEPLRERHFRERLFSGRKIRDRVSSAVQAQYEANPYPRWLAIARRDVETIEQRVLRWCPGYVAPAALRGQLRVLVAGCGTGMDAIEAALHLEGAQVTAVDLSGASLAYALRKAEEYGLENIQFRQQDILDLDRGGSPYHFIHCTGVLHHMENPATGLERLLALLIPGGVIKLALYSQVARHGLLAAREFIHTSGLAPRVEDIRAFRRQVLEDGEASPLADIIGSTDFFSLSECRDLLFHVHEVQFTLPEVGSLLMHAGLDFLGFELPIPQVEAGFRREHPGEALTSLEAWNAYELRHPESFRAMYQFWCRKRAI